MEDLRIPQVGDTVEVFDGRPWKNGLAKATIIRAKVIESRPSGLLDVVAHRPYSVGPRDGDREGDEYTLTNLNPPDANPFRSGQWRHASSGVTTDAVVKPGKPSTPDPPPPPGGPSH